MGDTVVVVPDDDASDGVTVADVIVAHDIGVVEATVEHVDDAVTELTETVEELAEVVEQLAEQPAVIIVAEPEAVPEIVEEIVEQPADDTPPAAEITPREATHPYTRPLSEWRGRRD